ncbi:MAG: RNHCP domain-containing protein, partial [Deltaproteobacteria bacterium]
MDRDDLLARLARTRSRGQVKALGAAADADPALLSALRALAAERGVPDADTLRGKVLVRRILARSEEARRRRNPIHRDEAFTCRWCGAAVPPGGRRVRDHCPWCLRSLHVDVVPGDRAADCGGILQPVELLRRGDEVVIAYRCDRCGHLHRCRAHPDDAIPPSLSISELPGEGSRRVHGRSRTLPRRVVEAIRTRGLWAPSARVLVAVSGGLDSTVLLEVLWRTQAAHGGRLEVCAVDHGLRPESAQEVADVLRRCETMGLPGVGVRVDVAPGPNLAARARTARRAALLARGADRIATAHHLDDQAETVLQRLMAGSGAA